MQKTISLVEPEGITVGKQIGEIMQSVDAILSQVLDDMSQTVLLIKESPEYAEEILGPNYTDADEATTAAILELHEITAMGAYLAASKIRKSVREHFADFKQVIDAAQDVAASRLSSKH